MKIDSIRTRARLNGISLNTVYSRIQRGWDKERALTTPVKKPGINIESKQRAIDRGWHIFTNPVPCKKCGDHRHYVSNHTCIMCQQATNARFQQRKKEAMKK